MSLAVAQKATLVAPHGTVASIYHDAGENTPLVVFVPGFNGFYGHSLFPFARASLQERGVSSFAFNYSHGGIVGESDSFEDLMGYQKNNIALRIEDLVCVWQYLQMTLRARHPSIFLFGHSMGCVVISQTMVKSLLDCTGVIYLNSVKSLRFFPDEMLAQWQQDGIFYQYNNRTKQHLPLGEAFLHDVLNCDTLYNHQDATAQIEKPLLIIYGDADESVQHTTSIELFGAVKKAHGANRMIAVSDGTHTLNTPHPFTHPSPQLLFTIDALVNWIEEVRPTISSFIAKHAKKK